MGIVNLLSAIKIHRSFWKNALSLISMKQHFNLLYFIWWYYMKVNGQTMARDWYNSIISSQVRFAWLELADRQPVRNRFARWDSSAPMKELADRQVETGLPTETTVYIPNLWKAPWWQQPVEVCSNQWGDFHSRIEQALRIEFRNLKI